jgi:ketosteroid isomerase-like protein
MRLPRIAVQLLCFALPAVAVGSPAEEAAVAASVQAMYTALRTDDATQFAQVTTPDFYAYDVGKQFTGEQLVALIKSAHAAGREFVWQVTEPRVYIEGNTAWLTYLNRGSVGDASGSKPVTWLESAVLHKMDGVWRIHFLHATRAAE